MEVKKKDEKNEGRKCRKGEREGRRKGGGGGERERKEQSDWTLASEERAGVNLSEDEKRE